MAITLAFGFVSQVLDQALGIARRCSENYLWCCGNGRRHGGVEEFGSYPDSLVTNLA
jgi:hypothetical protein